MILCVCGPIVLLLSDVTHPLRTTCIRVFIQKSGNFTVLIWVLILGCHT